jgi:hypothetical protein
LVGAAAAVAAWWWLAASVPTVTAVAAARGTAVDAVSEGLHFVCLFSANIKNAIEGLTVEGLIGGRP